MSFKFYRNPPMDLWGIAFLPQLLGHMSRLGSRTKWYGQNGTDKMVRTKIMAWTKWYTDKMVLDKMAWTKWYGQNGTDRISRIKSSINPTAIDNMIISL